MYTDNRDAGGPAEKPVARGARRIPQMWVEAAGSPSQESKKSDCDRKCPGRSEIDRTIRTLKATAGAGTPIAQARPADKP